MQWGLEDVISVFILLVGLGGLWLLIVKNIQNTTHRVLIGLAVVALVIYIWAELAVGVFTNWGS